MLASDRAHHAIVGCATCFCATREKPRRTISKRSATGFERDRLDSGPPTEPARNLDRRKGCDTSRLLMQNSGTRRGCSGGGHLLLHSELDVATTEIMYLESVGQRRRLVHRGQDVGRGCRFHDRQASCHRYKLDLSEGCPSCRGTSLRTDNKTGAKASNNEWITHGKPPSEVISKS